MLLSPVGLTSRIVAQGHLRANQAREGLAALLSVGEPIVAGATGPEQDDVAGLGETPARGDGVGEDRFMEHGWHGKAPDNWRFPTPPGPVTDGLTCDTPTHYVGGLLSGVGVVGLERPDASPPGAAGGYPLGGKVNRFILCKHGGLCKLAD